MDTKDMYVIWDVGEEIPEALCYCATKELAYFVCEVLEVRVPNVCIVGPGESVPVVCR